MCADPWISFIPIYFQSEMQKFNIWMLYGTFIIMGHPVVFRDCLYYYQSSYREERKGKERKGKERKGKERKGNFEREQTMVESSIRSLEFRDTMDI